MDLKRLAGTVLLSASPLLLGAPAAFADSGVTVQLGAGPAIQGAEPAEVAGVQAAVDQDYELRVLGWPQPEGRRVQAGEVSTRSLMRDDSRSGVSYPEVAGVQAAAVDVAGAQASDISDPEYLSDVLAWPQPAGVRVHPGMVGLSALQRGDSSANA